MWDPGDGLGLGDAIAAAVKCFCFSPLVLTARCFRWFQEVLPVVDLLKKISVPVCGFGSVPHMSSGPSRCSRRHSFSISGRIAPVDPLGFGPTLAVETPKCILPVLLAVWQLLIIGMVLFGPVAVGVK